MYDSEKMNNSMTLQIKTLEQYKEVYQESVEKPEYFWAKQAETFQWQQKWDSILEWDFKTPKIKWFAGGKLNITENCLAINQLLSGNLMIRMHQQRPIPIRNYMRRYVNLGMRLEHMVSRKGIGFVFTCQWYQN